jgi:hypothetical protein
VSGDVPGAAPLAVTCMPVSFHSLRYESRVVFRRLELEGTLAW